MTEIRKILRTALPCARIASKSVRIIHFIRAKILFQNPFGMRRYRLVIDQGRTPAAVGNLCRSAKGFRCILRNTLHAFFDRFSRSLVKGTKRSFQDRSVGNRVIRPLRFQFSNRQNRRIHYGNFPRGQFFQSQQNPRRDR